jgi:uncharacterized repeat protein (TIGR04138 family)
MPRKREELGQCEICYQAEATVHCCHAYGGSDRPAESHNYCAACYQKMEAAAGREVDLYEYTGDECCYYCGAHWEMGSPNHGPAMKVRKLKRHWRCGRCFPIESDYLRAELQKLQQGFLKEVQDQSTKRPFRARDLQLSENESQIFEDLYRRVDDHVRQVVGDDVQPQPWKPGAVRPYHKEGKMVKMMGELAARDSRYAKEAYLFVLAGSEGAAMKYPEERNCTATELLVALRGQALDRFGPKAKSTLNSWGVFQCEDFGEIVFNLVEEQLLGKTAEDKKKDFSGGYDFDAAFPA